MPIVNTQGQFSTGRDVQIILQGDFGEVEITNITGFEARQDTKTINVDRLDGIHLSAEVPQRWTGTIEFERGDNAVDLFFANKEAAWFANGQYRAATLYEIIAEANGSSTSFAYDNVALKLDAGRWAGDAAVRSRIEFIANRRRPV